jgi:hypothetical protein
MRRRHDGFWGMTTLNWATGTDLARDCGDSRLWGGVHFRPAITAGHALGEQLGEGA